MTDRFHTWHQALDGPLWRHGRATFDVDGLGRHGYPNGTGPRQDLGVAVEWRLFPRRGFGVGVELKWGTNGSDTTPDLAVHLGRVGDLWVHLSGVIPYRWLERHRPDGKVDYDTRVFAVNVGTSGFRWEFWARDGAWSRRDPWWMLQSHRWVDLFYGRADVDEVVLDTGTCVVPMPEANYPATYEITEYTRRYRRPLGKLRDRVLGPRVHHTTQIEPGRPVPVPGKGENSWDIGDDAIHASSQGGRNIDEAIGGLVASALRTRRRHGGQHMNVAAS